MGSKTCMNMLCGESTSGEGRKGWPLRSGESAVLCDKCGSVYEESIFCDIFHAKDSGWRECTSCGKRLHCGCIASRFLLELLDCGGVSCVSCARSSGLRPMANDEKPTDFGMLNAGPGELRSASGGKHYDGDGFEKLKLMQPRSNIENSGLRYLLQHDDPNSLSAQMKQEDVLPSPEEIGKSRFQFSSKASNGAANNLDDSLAQPNLSIALGGPSGSLNPFLGVVFDEKGQSRTLSLSQQGSKSRHLLPKPPKSAIPSALEANRGIVPQIRVARPPAEGRGRNQLLPRYWPRITDQELQQISGDSNSTIVPLFEKVLSASDAGRIGRLVLPKACAEAYFPPISQPEGLPLRIQDVKGKEWVFQFRFWPNNNSRMYVLEGVTPCIQSMQLQAGDTVTFSRMEPEGKLIMGFRKASASVAMQETQLSAMTNGTHSTEAFFSGSFENLPVISGYSSFLQSLKGNADPHINALSKHFTSTSGDINWQNSEKNEGRREPFLPPSMLAPDRKRTRNIGMNSKRLLIDSQEALELKLTWEEAQDLLRPPLGVQPSVVVVEDHAFEEYDEPPVFGKRSIFVIRSSGMQEQWAQCDGCAKWRKLPVDILLPARWTCTDNSSDESRCSCSAPEELGPREMENLLRLNKDFKRQRLAAASFRLLPDVESSSGLDALANAAILGDSTGGAATTSSVAATTKHPRHRPGCSCIVCIQPPSGKGKHKPTCNCNVCMTVKRRFKTLMMRKKKRQSEREAEIAQQKNRKTWAPKDEAEADSSSRNLSPLLDSSEPQSPINDYPPGNSVDISKGQTIDLNCQPERDEDPRGTSRVSMLSLLQVASQPLESYLKQNGLTSLVSEQQESGSGQVQAPASAESEGHDEEDHDRDLCGASEVQEKLPEQDEDMGQEPSGPDQSQT
ncbi:B3 domain-containing transcription repressor VAL2 [Punica granatum]|uniref:B3 domain-containing transcription repressor VAL2 n=1 Tax=Punica granatum TaxID=22663 RepID=A0A6P8CK45_PUNGR|nr:B3 domain-containing transcription repressor VAL2 [Punica granatum]